ncbi:MAG: DUF3805 domain-containing protein [Candidatus Nealsonbacteria bacterium]|nr:DUF3805 domain-containing protein [Candidatus Nealsonbacteria bacterium]
MKKIIFITLGFLILIIALGAAAIWLTPDLSNPETLENIALRLQKISSLGDGSTTTDQFKKFISPDADFEMEYPADWQTIDNENFLQAMVPQDWAEKYNLRALFLAQNFLQGKSNQLIVYAGIFKIPIKEIFEKMQETNRSNGWTVETLKLETNGSEGTFEGEYVNPAGAHLRSKEKILSRGEKTYWVAFFASEESWLEFINTVDKILKSATIE